MTRRTLAVVALTLFAGAVLAVTLVPATCQAQRAKVTAISRSHTKVGARLTIKGSYFGSRQGSSTVTFGERRNTLGFAPCSRKARVISWSRSSITVRVPSMSPGKAGEPGTYHPIYVTVGGAPSNRVTFYIDPVSVNPNITGATRTYDARTGITTYTNHSLGGIAIQPMHDVLWDNCVFTNTNPNLPGGEAGVVMLRGAHPRMTFLGCTFTSNTGPGGGSEGNRGVNG